MAEVRAEDGARLHVVDQGDGPATVVLAHGWALGSSTWDEVAASLVAAGLRVVRYDQRGHGSSEAGELGDLTVRRLGHDLAAVLDHVGSSVPVVVVAHSMGGMATLALVAEQPDRLGTSVHGAVLVSTSAGQLDKVGLGLPAPLRPLAARSITPVMTHLHGRTRGKERGPLVALADRLTRRSSFGRRADRAQVAAARALIAATDPEVIVSCSRAISAHDEAAALESLRSVPVRVLVGSRDVLTPVGHARRIAEAAAARLIVVPEAGHMLHVEAADVVVAEVQRVVRDVIGQQVERTPA